MFTFLRKRGSAWSVPDPAVEQSAKATAQATSITVEFVSPPATGHVIVAFVTLSNYGGARTVTPPAGFSEIADSTAGSYLHMTSFVKVAGGSETGSYQFSISGTAEHCGIVAYDISGADTVDPIYAYATNGVSPSATINILKQAGIEGGLVIAAAGSEAALAQPSITTGWTIDQYATPKYNTCCGASRDDMPIPLASATFTYSTTTTLVAHMVVIRPTGAGAELLWLQTADGADDVQWGVGLFEVAYASFGKYAANDRNAMLRFTNVPIAQGATIKSAKLWFHPNDNNSVNEQCNGIVSGVDEDSPAAPTSESQCNALTLTTASVAWSAVPPWAANTWYGSPDIKAIIQEIVDREGWASGNALIVVIKDSSSSSNAFRGGESHPSDNRVALVIEV